MHNTTRRSAIARTLLSLGGSALPGGYALAQDYPNKAIRIVVPFGPGGPSDLISRMIALKLTDAMKQPVIVENKPGASGIVGADLVAKAAPDGYTMLVINQLLVQVPALYASVPFDPLRDFIPIVGNRVERTVAVLQLITNFLHDIRDAGCCTDLRQRLDVTLKPIKERHRLR